jgi:hypothetical protein
MSGGECGAQSDERTDRFEGNDRFHDNSFIAFLPVRRANNPRKTNPFERLDLPSCRVWRIPARVAS